MTAAAARLDDPIEHSSALGGLLAGLAIGAGAVLIGIAVVGTGGLGAIALAAMVGAGAATGAGVGQLIGSLSFACRETGQIRSGSSNVYINGNLLRGLIWRIGCLLKVSIKWGLGSNFGNVRVTKRPLYPLLQKIMLHLHPLRLARLQLMTTPTKQQLLDEVTEIDNILGFRFTPLVG